MRIVMVGPFAWAPKGTVSARAFLMAQVLVEKGHQVSILMPPYDNPQHAGYEWSCDGVQLLNMRMPSWGDSARAKLSVPLAMARRILGFEPDAVHVFKPIGYAGLTGVHLRSFCPCVPLVLDMDDWDGTGGWADVNRYPPLWRAFSARQEHWLARNSDVITVASRTLESHAWGLGVRPERVLYLPNGPAPFFAQRHPIALEAQIAVRRALGVGDAPLAVYAGHLTYASEVDLIIEALPAVVEVVTDIRVVIVGGGPGLKPLQERVQRLRLSDWVLFAGWRPQQELPELLAAADVALYPHRDTLINRAKSPSKITAYMAMGKPIVASSVGESAEYLEGGRAGLLVPPDDAQAFAKGMVTILRDKTLAAELGQRAYERVWAQYDWQKRVGTIERAYCIAIEAHAASRCKCRPQMVV